MDLPEPLTPVTQTNRPSGISRSTALRLCSRAPSTRSQRSPGARRTSGVGITRRPERNIAGQRRLGLEEPFQVAGVDDVATVLPGPGTDVHDVVGGRDRRLVVLDDDERVAEVPQPDQRVDQPAVVALMEPDRRLVEDVEHADEAAPDLGREPDPLRLAARERRGSTRAG